MPSYRLDPAAITTLLSTELNSLANNAAAFGVEYDNAASLFANAVFRLEATFGSNPTAGNTIDLYLIMATDGSNYGDYTSGASGKAPVTSYIGSFPLEAKTTIHRIDIGAGPGGPLPLPPTKFKLLAINKSGVSFPSSGSTIKMIPYATKSI